MLQKKLRFWEKSGMECSSGICQNFFKIEKTQLHMYVCVCVYVWVLEHIACRIADVLQTSNYLTSAAINSNSQNIYQ